MLIIPSQSNLYKQTKQTELYNLRFSAVKVSETTQPDSTDQDRFTVENVEEPLPQRVPLKPFPYNNPLANRRIVRELLQGKYDGISQEVRQEIVDNPEAIHELVHDPEAIANLFLAGQLASPKHKAVLESLADSKGFQLIVEPNQSPQALKIREHLQAEPLTFHDMVENPRVLANLYQWIGELELEKTVNLAKQLERDLALLNKQYPSKLDVRFPGRLSDLADTDQLFNSTIDFPLETWIEDERKIVLHYLDYCQDRDYSHYRLFNSFMDKNPDYFNQFWFWQRDAEKNKLHERIEKILDFEEERLKKTLAIIQKYEQRATQTEVQYEMMMLMAQLVRTLEPQIKKVFTDIKSNPISAFQELFGKDPMAKAGQPGVQFRGSIPPYWQHLPALIYEHYSEPPRPTGVKTTLGYSLLGAFSAGLFAGIVGLACDLVNTGYKKVTSLFLESDSSMIFRREAWIEDVVGKQMLNKLFKTYNLSTKPNDQIYPVLSSAASKVAAQGFFMKLMGSICKGDVYADWLQTAVTQLAKTPIPKSFEHISALHNPHSSFQAMIEQGIKNSQNTSITERLPAILQWCAKWIPQSVIEQANQVFEPLLRHGDHWLDGLRTVVQEIPLLEPFLTAIGSSFPFKAEILTGATSLSYNMVTGLGNMALIETAMRLGGRLPEQEHKILSTENHWQVLKLYIRTIKEHLGTSQIGVAQMLETLNE
jgi:hypothetical protein